MSPWTSLHFRFSHNFVLNLQHDLVLNLGHLLPPVCLGALREYKTNEQAASEHLRKNWEELVMLSLPRAVVLQIYLWFLYQIHRRESASQTVLSSHNRVKSVSSLQYSAKSTAASRGSRLPRF